MADERSIPGGVVHELPKDLEVTLKLHPGALATWGDISELVINALKHAFPGRNEMGHIAVDYQANANGWSLTVNDDGGDACRRRKSEAGAWHRHC